MLNLMSLLKQSLKLTTLTIYAVILAACGVVTPAPTVTATTVPTSTLVIPTSTEPPPTPSSTPIPTETLTISSPPDGLRMAYIIDGNLYFQDGSNPSRQLTNSGEDRVRFFSENGEKIYFLRGMKPPFELYSINVDGSSEQVLVTNDLLQALDPSYTESTGFHSVTIVPNTSLLLFGTLEFQSNTPIWNGDLLRVDTDTAEIKRLLPPGQVLGFYVSPDGKFIAIDARGEINILDIEGKFVHRSLVIYTPSEPTFLAPGISWMPDSKGLVVSLPVPTTYETSASGPSYTVWRYTLDDGTGVQVPLDILPTENDMATVSLDGNWILYNNNDQYTFYIGNLRTGHTEPYKSREYIGHYPSGWNVDNEHFIYSASPGRTLYIGSVDGSPQLIGEGDFLGWIDANRFLYYAYRDKNIVMGDIQGSKEIIFVDRESFKNIGIIFTFIFPKAGNR